MNNIFETFTALIAKIHKNIKKLKKMEVKEYNLKGIHVSIVYYLYLFNSLTAKELTIKCEEDKGSISKALNFLEKNDYVTCDAKFIKRYNSPFLLTKLGKEVGNKISNKIQSILDKVKVKLSEEERIKFYNYLQEICLSLDGINNSY